MQQVAAGVSTLGHKKLTSHPFMAIVIHGYTCYKHKTADYFPMKNAWS